MSVVVSRSNAPSLKLVPKEPSLPKRAPGAQLPEHIPDDPERRHRMTRADALQMFEPLPLPVIWTVYASAPVGEVAARIPTYRKIFTAARLLYEMGTVDLAQRRTEDGTEYLMRRSRR